ncbi:high affinity immunoglobulin epsilon receptor subunit beta-like isoform X1 [Vicugna pacos]|uniref:high affinity immunoglobulin epsilon receptor subunit beta-like isoform X1 n=1 Tax=Vicugna pacos TaxID=30538 RepID=UPI003BB85619
MSNIVDAIRDAEGIPTNKIQSTRLEQADTSHFAQYRHSKLNNFLKNNLQSLGAAQIMIGSTYFLFGIIEIFFYWSSDFRNFLFCFYIGYPFWAAMSFIISGSLTVACTKKHTKFLVTASIGDNIISTVLSSIGIILLSMNLVHIIILGCSEFLECSLVKSFTTSIVILQMMLTYVQIVISFSLCGLTYHVNGNDISLVSALSCCIRSDSEDPYQDLLTPPDTYGDVILQDTDPVNHDP